MAYKYLFFNDYSEGAHPAILETLSKTNTVQESGYGEDSLCSQASELIKQKINNPNADIHFVSGGTQANLIVLASILKPYQSVIAANSAHIAVHEAGAIEATGHKINTITTTDGKLTPDQIESTIAEHNMEHMVKPKVVFISHPTEVGTIYSKSELQAISQICKQHNLYLYLDGARLGSALTAINSDLSLAQISSLVDIFYIGGTKNGALIGEAIVINHNTLKDNFRFHLKQRGALLAKGRLLGAQFLTLFTNNVYLDLATHANQMASHLTTGIKDLGFSFLTDSTTNQIFPIFPNTIIDQLQKDYGFYVWQKIDDHQSAIRLVTSWATKQEIITEFLSDLQKISNPK